MRSNDGRVDVWDIASRQTLVTLRDRSNARQPSFAPDGKSLAAINGQWIKACDVPTTP